MRSKYHHNAILTGYESSFCLVCECIFESEDMALQHIGLLEHERKLLAFPYEKDYESDCIRLVNYGYYCEYCNKIINNPSDVLSHVIKDYHYDNKRTNAVQRINGTLVAFNNVVIDEKSWHSITNGGCYICDKFVTNDDSHMDDPSHLLELVQNKVEIKDHYIYRTTDDMTFQCLTCNTILPKAKIQEHFSYVGHIIHFMACKKAFDDKFSANKGAIPKRYSSLNNELQMKTGRGIKKPKKSDAKDVCEPSTSANSDVSASTSSLQQKEYQEDSSSESLGYDDPIKTNVTSIQFENEQSKARAIRIDSYINAVRVITLAESVAAARLKSNKEKASNAIKFAEDEDCSSNNDTSKTDDFVSKPGCSHYDDAQTNSIVLKNEFVSNAKLSSEDDYESELNISYSEETENESEIDTINLEVDSHNFLKSPTLLDLEVRKQDELEMEYLCLMRRSSEETIARVESAYKSVRENEETEQVVDSPEIFASNNYMMILNPDKAYCTLCLVKVNLEIQYVWRHVHSRKHKTLEYETKYHQFSSYLSSFSPDRAFIPFKMHMTDYVYDIEPHGDGPHIVLNKTFCLSKHSCIMVYNVSNTYFDCYLCEVQTPFQDVVLHMESSIKHERMMDLALVLTELREEFVREISPTKLHCGFCNIILPSLRDLMDHLKGLDHKNKKLTAYNNLYGYLLDERVLVAISNIKGNIPFIPNWPRRKPPGIY